MGVLREHCRPEYLNRVDEVIVFRTLSREQIAEIVDIQVTRLEKRLAERRIVLRLTPAARELIAARGWDPVYGARPLRRTIQKLLQDQLALRLLQGDFSDGDVIEVDVDPVKDELVFERTRSNAAAAV